MMLSVSAIRKNSHAREMNNSNSFQNRRAGPYAPIEMKRVKKFAKVLTMITVGRNRLSHTYPAGSFEVATSMGCILVLMDLAFSE